MNVFEETRNRVTMQEVAAFYGFQPNRSGFICCPFHREKTASLKIYQGSRGWHCFGCGAGGSVIDFVAKMHGVTPLDAVKTINEYFRLDLPIDKPRDWHESKEAQEKREKERLFREWRDTTLQRLTLIERKANLALRKEPEEWTEAEEKAIHKYSLVQYWSDAIAFGEEDKQRAIYDSRGDIEAVCKEILTSDEP